MDNELFELCKEVYKKTGWVTGGHWVMIDGVKKWYVDYTSDYLLEKLPKNIKDGSDFIWAWLSMDCLGDDGWQFGYRKGAAAPLIKAISDTPFKALLKLVIALDDAGVKL